MPDNDLHNTVIGIQQVQMEHQSNLVIELQDRLHAKELENAELKAVKRKAEEDEEPLSVPKKLRFTEDEDDAWTNINKSARMVRPFCGDWDTRFKDLGRKADPIQQRMDRTPMGALTLAPVTIKKLPDRGSELTVRMFWPKNHDVRQRQRRISVNKDNTYLEPTLDFKDPRETWELVEALNTYTLALHRVWPEDWTGLALQRDTSPKWCPVTINYLLFSLSRILLLSGNQLFSIQCPVNNSFLLFYLLIGLVLSAFSAQ